MNIQTTANVKEKWATWVKVMRFVRRIHEEEEEEEETKKKMMKTIMIGASVVLAVVPEATTSGNSSRLRSELIGSTKSPQCAQGYQKTATTTEKFRTNRPSIQTNKVSKRTKRSRPSQFAALLVLVGDRMERKTLAYIALTTNCLAIFWDPAHLHSLGIDWLLHKTAMFVSYAIFNSIDGIKCFIGIRWSSFIKATPATLNHIWLYGHILVNLATLSMSFISY
jgi:hypothetical protein